MSLARYFIVFILAHIWVGTTHAQSPITSKDSTLQTAVTSPSDSISKPVLTTAQQDSIDQAWKHTASYIAKRTAMKSALIPGWGQYINKQYWKIPVIYAGVGVAIYSMVYNYNKYQEFTQAYLYKVDGDPNTDLEKFKYTSESVIQSYQRNYRQSLEYTVLFTVIGYAVNIIDAVVYSHLQKFDIGRSLSFSLKILMQTTPNTPALAFGISFQHKNHNHEHRTHRIW